MDRDQVNEEVSSKFDYINEREVQRRDSINKLRLASRKGRKERERHAGESTSWGPEIKPYRRGE